MGLVHDEPAHPKRRHPVEEAGSGESFRGDVEQTQLPRRGRLERLELLGPLLRGVDVRDWHAGRAQAIDLVLHERDQGRDHQREAATGHRRHPVADALAGPGRSDREHVAARELRVHHRRLARTELLQAEDLAQHAQPGVEHPKSLPVREPGGEPSLPIGGRAGYVAARSGVPYAMNRKKLLLVLLSLAGLATVAACGLGGGGASASRPAAGRAANVSSSPQPADERASASGSPAPSQSPSSLDGQAASIPEGPRVQRSARVVLQVGSGRFDSALNDVIAVVDQAGGYISGSQAQADDGQPLRSGQVTFQVPADRFEAVVAEVRKKGTPQTISISGNDVSQQYVDLQARLRNAEAQRNAMLALMQQAKSVNDTIQIQNQLGQITAQIEQLRGQIGYLEHSTTFSTLAVSIREAPAGARDEWGLQTAALQALHNVVNVVAVVIVVAGTLLPLLVVGFVVAFALWRAWPRLRRTGRPSPGGAVGE